MDDLELSRLLKLWTQSITKPHLLDPSLVEQLLSPMIIDQTKRALITWDGTLNAKIADAQLLITRGTGNKSQLLHTIATLRAKKSQIAACLTQCRLAAQTLPDRQHYQNIEQLFLTHQHDVAFWQNYARQWFEYGHQVIEITLAMQDMLLGLSKTHVYAQQTRLLVSELISRFNTLEPPGPPDASTNPLNQSVKSIAHHAYNKR